MMRESAALKSLLLVGLFLSSLFAAGLVSQPQPVLIVEEVDSASGGARHLYTFADGSSEAIAIYHLGHLLATSRLPCRLGPKSLGPKSQSRAHRPQAGIVLQILLDRIGVKETLILSIHKVIQLPYR